MKKKNHLASLIVIIVLLGIAMLSVACVSNKITLATPSNFKFDSSTKTVSWDSVNNALSYEIVIESRDGNGSPITKETTTNSYLLEESGKLKVKIKAKGDNIVFSNSEYSEYYDIDNIISLKKVSNVKHSFDDGQLKVSFDSVLNASGYAYTVTDIYGENIHQDIQIQGNSFAFDSKTISDYTISITSVGNNVDTFDSEPFVFDVSVSDTQFITKSFAFDIVNGDLTIPFTKGLAVITKVFCGDLVMSYGDDYSIDTVNDKLIINQSYLNKMTLGVNTFKVNTYFSQTNISLTLSDTRPITLSKTVLNYTEYPEDATDRDDYVDLVINSFNHKLTRITVVCYNSGIPTNIQLSDVDYIYNASTGGIRLKAQVFRGLEIGQHSIVFTTTNGTVEASINILSNGIPYIDGEMFEYNQASSTRSDLVIKVNNATYSSFNTSYQVVTNDDLNYVDYSQDGKTALTRGTHYTMSGNTFVFKKEYLDTLDMREHTFVIITKQNQIVFYVNVSNNSATVQDVRVDYDSSGNTILQWDFPKLVSYSVLINGSTYTVSDNYLDISDFGFSESISVTIIPNGYASSTHTVDFSSTVVGDNDYSNMTYRYLGVEHNRVLTSHLELVNYIEYLYFTNMNDGRIFSQTQEEVIIRIPNTSTNADFSSNISSSNKVAMERVGSIRNGMSVQYKYNSSSGYVSFSISYSEHIRYYSPNNKTSQAQVANNELTPGCHNFYNSERTANSPLPIDSNPLTQSVINSSQLYYALENGVRPVPTSGSDAERIYNAARLVLRQIVDDKMNDRDKVHFIYDWLVEEVTYDTVCANLKGLTYEWWSYNCFYLEGVFDDKVAVCDGIAKAFTIMCRIEGIEAIRVEGRALSGRINHAWNKYKIDGNWYGADATWGDLSSSTVGQAILSHRFVYMDERELSINYRYEKNAEYIAVNSLDITMYSDKYIFAKISSLNDYIQFVNNSPAGVVLEIECEGSWWGSSSINSNLTVSGNGFRTSSAGVTIIYFARSSDNE